MAQQFGVACEEKQQNSKKVTLFAKIQNGDISPGYLLLSIESIVMTHYTNLSYFYMD